MYHMDRISLFLLVLFGFGIGCGTCSFWIPPKLSEAHAVEPPKEDLGPLHGKNPMFTAVPLEVCPSRGGSFCPYEICGNSTPQTPYAGKLWNATVVGGATGPIVVCEWR